MKLQFCYEHSPDSVWTEEVDGDWDVEELKKNYLKPKVEDDSGKDAIVFIKKLYSFDKTDGEERIWMDLFPVEDMLNYEKVFIETNMSKRILSGKEGGRGKSGGALKNTPPKIANSSSSGPSADEVAKVMAGADASEDVNPEDVYKKDLADKIKKTMEHVQQNPNMISELCNSDQVKDMLMNRDKLKEAWEKNPMMAEIMGSEMGERMKEAFSDPEKMQKVQEVIQNGFKKQGA